MSENRSTNFTFPSGPVLSFWMKNCTVKDQWVTTVQLTRRKTWQKRLYDKGL